MALQEYGLGWWKDKHPRSDIEVWSMSGLGNQFCMVLPKYGIVITKLRDWELEGDNYGKMDFINILRGSLEPHVNTSGY